MRKSTKLGTLDQKKCEQVIYILTISKFKYEAIMADFGKQENGNFINISVEVLAQNWENTSYFEFGKGPLFGPKFGLGNSVEIG